MPTREELFERWLKQTTNHVVREAHYSLYEQEDDEEEEDDAKGDEGNGDEDAESGIEDALDDIDVDVEDDDAETRGGPQVPDAAKREMPAPDVDDLTMELIIDKLNAIRSGKSLKDKGVQQRVAEYFSDLSSAQRLALFAFLEGLAEVIALEVPGDDARAPNDPDIGVQMDATKEDDNSARVAKKGTEEYSGGQKRVVKGGDGKKSSSGGVPAASPDAHDDAPVMVTYR